MPRYIDADALNAAIEEWFDDVCVYDVSPSEATNDFQSIVDEQPTISTDEVLGVGKWEKDSDGLYVCSECGEIALQRVFIKLPDKIVDLQMVRSKFCPNCGARMGGVQDALS